jgi:hypothetical protein
MRGTRLVRFDRHTLAAVLTLDPDAVRVRLPAGECDRLGLYAGKRVAMAIEDGGTHPAVVTEVRPGGTHTLVAVQFPARAEGGGDPEGG